MTTSRHRGTVACRRYLSAVYLLAIATTSVTAFPFWSSPSRLLGKVMNSTPPQPQAQQPETSAQQSTGGARHQKLTAHPSTSTTTTTTTTTQPPPPPPIELHFEINPEGLTPDAAPGGNDEQTVANGSLILEDLVNQIARNFQDGLSRQRTSNKSSVDLRELPVEPTTPQMSMQLLEEPKQQHDEDDRELAGQQRVGFELSTSHDSLVDPPAEEPDPDRHIQYDMTNMIKNQHDDNNRDDSTHQALHAQDSRQLTLTGELNSNQTRRPTPPTLTVSQTLSNVTIPQTMHQFERRTLSPLENDTSIQGPPMSTGNNSRVPSAAAATAAINLIQARSMSPGSSGHLSSLNNHRPPPVVGQKPPYASSYQMAHHRGALDLTNAVAREGSLGASQVAPPANKRQEQTNELLSANSINSISSSLLMSDSLGQQAANTTKATATTTSTTTSTTTPKPPTLPGLAQTLQNYLAAAAAATTGSGNSGFSERHDERAEELERVANKLAPSELTELNPIESPSMSNSAHQLHYQAATSGFPADTGSSPADSNNVIVSRYHNDLFGSGSGLSEPANSISSYLQATSQQSASVDAESGGGGELNQRAHDAKGGAPAAGLATSASGGGGDDEERDDRVSPPQVQVHRRTIETLSNQIANADSNLVSANTLAVHQHRERSPPAHNGRGAPSSGHNRHHGQTTGGGGSYAASLINVTAPMVLPLSATEAMEAALGDPTAARQMMHQVGGGTTLMQVVASSGGGAGGGPASMQAVDHEQSYTSSPAHTTLPHRSSYYVIPPPPQAAPSDGHHHQHLSIYSRPANQFRPTSSTTFPPSTAETQSAYDSQPPQTTMSAAERDRMRLGDGSYLQQQQPPPPGSQQASGFRSPFGQYPAVAAAGMAAAASLGLPTPSSYLSGMSAPPLSSTSSPQSSNKFVSSTPPSIGTTNATVASTVASLNRVAPGKQQFNSSTTATTTTNGFITGSVTNSSSSGSGSSNSLAGIVSATNGGDMGLSVGGTGGLMSSVGQSQQSAGNGGATSLGKRVFNLTRVEHISAECSNDLIRTIIIFNGTFKGIIYSSGYVRDTNCLYVNGTGKTRYDFSIKLNQCGTLGRQEIHPAVGGPGGDGIRRRDQVMWNTLSIQYNPIIEQEWDEHFRVSCEYGSDFWKTISFSPFNVETNTGSPVVFTVDPPQCQMEILKGHGMVGPRQETIQGPVTVGDPLTLLIHMKSEKAGYDILVKNCVAHNGGQQKMQLIDTNGCVVNERFISPFRGTYNDNDLKHVTLYSYLKAFRFTGSPVLYLECEVHMCQSACPPQMCYWRRLSKRSTTGHLLSSRNSTSLPYYDPSLEEFDVNYSHSVRNHEDDQDQDDDEALEQSHYVKTIRFNATTTTIPPIKQLTASKSKSRQGRELRRKESGVDNKRTSGRGSKPQDNLSDKISLFQALEVRQERDESNSESGPSASGQRLTSGGGGGNDLYEIAGDASQLMCYQRIEIFAFLFTVASILLAAVSVTIGCYYRASSLRRVAASSATRRHQRDQHYNHEQQQRHALNRKQRPLHIGQFPLASSLSLSSANLCYSPFSSSSSSSSATSSCSPSSTSSERADVASSSISPPGGVSLGCKRPPLNYHHLMLDQNLHFGRVETSDSTQTRASNNCRESNSMNLNEIGAHFRFQQPAVHHPKRQLGP